MLSRPFQTKRCICVFPLFSSFCKGCAEHAHFIFSVYLYFEMDCSSLTVLRCFFFADCEDATYLFEDFLMDHFLVETYRVLDDSDRTEVS